MLIRRIRQLILANANDTLDRIEDPEQTAAQMLREIDGGIRHARVAVIDAVASEKQLANAVDKHRQRVDELESKARLALQRNDEELARSLLEQKITDEKLVEELTTALCNAAQSSAKLKSRLDELHRERQKFCVARSSLASRKRVAVARNRLSAVTGATDSPSTVDESLARLTERIETMEAESLAYEEVCVEMNDPERQADALAVSERVNAELAKLRAGFYADEDRNAGLTP